MNTDLSRHYGKLSKRERVALIQAAWGRGDDKEAERLIDSSPVRYYEMGEHVWYGTALRLVELAYLAEQLDRVVCLHRCLHLADDMDDPPRLLSAIKALSYRIATAADGWVLFCRGIGFEPPGGLADLSGWQTVIEGADLARVFAYTQVEMANAQAEHGLVDAVMTPELWAEQWRETLEKLA